MPQRKNEHKQIWFWVKGKFKDGKDTRDGGDYKDGTDIRGGGAAMFCFSERAAWIIWSRVRLKRSI